MPEHKVAKFFNTAGPGKSDLNYMIDPLSRINYDEISTLIDQQRYFVLHAPRQTGKTTSLQAIVKKINGEGRYYCVYVNVEPAQTTRNNVAEGMRVILSGLGEAIETALGDEKPLSIVPALLEKFGGHKALSSMLKEYCQTLDKPLVLLIDEIDALIGDTLVSVLRQLREGYDERPRKFPIAVLLCGVRDVRDYRIHQSSGEIITGGSCFNIKAESLRLEDFSQEDIRELYLQHTEATGQMFEENIFPKVWELTHGQPWLVNALANQATSKMPEGRDRSNPITLEVIEQAANLLILERATHLDQLADKLREDRVKRVIAPMVAGENWRETQDGEPQGGEPLPDDVQYVIDLGLLRRDGIDNKGPLVISNAIYREIIPRELTVIMQDKILAAYQDHQAHQELWYVEPDGKLNMTGLLQSFQQFFRENSESWLERFDYKEAGFQLLFQAFLQRIVNGGGLINREYALGSGRVDLLIRWQSKEQGISQRIVLELKTVRVKSSPEKVLADGLKQTARYAGQSDATEAHLLICDERPGREWDEKISNSTERYGERDIYVWKM